MAKKSFRKSGARARAPARGKSTRRGFTPRAGTRAANRSSGVQRLVVQHVMQAPQSVMAPFHEGGPLAGYLQGLFSQGLPQGGVAIPGFGSTPAAAGPVKVPDNTRRKKSKL